MTTIDRDAQGRLVKGNTISATAPLKHGGAGAVRALTSGETFRGLAAKTEAEVKTDLEDEGRAAMIREQAVRLHTTARLYWSAIQGLADKAQGGDPDVLKRFDGYVARFGWLAGASLRAWEQDRRESKDQPPALDYDEMVKHLKRQSQEAKNERNE